MLRKIMFIIKRITYTLYIILIDMLYSLVLAYLAKLLYTFYTIL